MELPTRNTITTERFIQFMEWIWDGADSVTYVRYHNARDTARALGAKLTGHPADWKNPDAWEVWTFENGQRVRINQQGAGVELPRHTMLVRKPRKQAEAL